jgi:hypothetical protein
MKNFSLILLAVFMFAADTFAQVRPPRSEPSKPAPRRPVVRPNPGRPVVRPNPGRPNPNRPVVRPNPGRPYRPVVRPRPINPRYWGRYNPPPVRYVERDFYFFYDDRQFVNVPDICNANYVRFAVFGDTLIVNNLEVLYSNGERQSIAYNGAYSEQYPVDWKDLSGFNRCIIGFHLDAYTETDVDLDDSYVVFYAYVNDNYGAREVQLDEPLVINDWNGFRGYRRPVNPGPVTPPSYEPAPPAYTVRSVDMQQWQRVEKFSHLVNFSVNQSFVTEVTVKASKNDVTIKSAAYKDASTGRAVTIPALYNVTVPKDGQITARISMEGMAMVQTVTLEVVSNLFGSRADINLEIGVAR